MNTVRKLLAILTPRERVVGLALIGLMFVSMLLEMLGIGIIVPALAAMSSGGAAPKSAAAQAWLEYLGSPSQSQLILLGLCAILVLYVTKTAFLLYSNWRQATFIARFQSRISEQLFRGYMMQPWSYHLGRNTADLVRTLSETATIASACSALLGLLAESLVLVGILSLLLWHEPLGALSVAALMGFATWILQAATRLRLQRWGSRYWHHIGQAHRIFTEGLQGAKDIKVLGREERLFDQVAHHKREQARLGARNTAAQQLPRLWFELVAVAGLCLLTFVMVREGKTAQAMVPTLGLFAAAAFRMLPSANRLIVGAQTLRFTSAMIDVVHADLSLRSDSPQRASQPLAFRDAIRLEGVSFRYKDACTDALADVSMSIACGSAVGLIGGSGAGKSTIVDILLGLLAPTSGRVTVDGVDICSDVRRWQALVGYVPQSIFLADDTIRANVAFGIDPDHIDDNSVRRALAAAQLDGFIAELPEGWNTLVGERGVRLSGGQRQRIGIARALYHDPQVLLLDEATSALDTETEKGVMAAVESLHGEKTLVIVAHRLTTVAGCDVLYRLEHGRVVAEGSFQEVAT